MKKSTMVMIAILFSITIPALVEINVGQPQNVQMDKVSIHANDASLSVGNKIDVRILL